MCCYILSKRHSRAGNPPRTHDEDNVDPTAGRSQRPQHGKSLLVDADKKTAVGGRDDDDDGATTAKTSPPPSLLLPFWMTITIVF